MIEFRAVTNLKSLPRRRKQLPTRSVSTDVWLSNAITSSAGFSPVDAYPPASADISVSAENSNGLDFERKQKVSFSSCSSFSGIPSYGDLSKWSWKIPAQQTRDLFSVIWDENQACFVYSTELARDNRKRQIDVVQVERDSASLAFARTADERSMLGMAGKTAPDHLIPEPPARAFGAAEGGPARTGAGRPLRATPTTLRFEYLGPDPNDPSAFFFSRPDRQDPVGGGPQCFRLACSRALEWRPAAPRFYGPGPEWGGAWGGGLTTYSNALLSNQPVRGKERWRDWGTVCVCT